MSKTVLEKNRPCTNFAAETALLTVPQCELRMEECKGGCKIYCICDDKRACVQLHDLCRAMTGCPCSVICTHDGLMVCRCEFDCCECNCEMLADGICIGCTSQDKCSVEMIQTLCRCLCCCQEGGCNCTVCLNRTPVCHSAC